MDITIITIVTFIWIHGKRAAAFASLTIITLLKFYSMGVTILIIVGFSYIIIIIVFRLAVAWLMRSFCCMIRSTIR